MTQHSEPHWHYLRLRALMPFTSLLLALGLFLPSLASANFETVKTFEEPEAQQIDFRAGLAINLGGAGGVSPGTLYIGGRAGTGGINRFDSKGNFQGHWGTFSSFGIAVDQTTGNVYTISESTLKGVVTVFTADGATEVTPPFGEHGVFGETVSEGPDKIHRVSVERAGLAVDGAGNVYIADQPLAGNEGRIMEFELVQTPEPHYVYAGRSKDIAVGFRPNHPTFDSSGNLYVIGEQNAIYEFAPGQPATPVCSFKLATGGIVGITVNPTTGEVFYSSFKDKEIHQLTACHEGKFTEIVGSAFKPNKPEEPEPEEIDALAFNPALSWEPSRPQGMLYGLSFSRFGGEPNYIFAPAEVHLAEVESESVSQVTSGSATLNAGINPKGASTRYTFEYTSEADFQINEFALAEEVPAGGAFLGAGQQTLEAAATISGLKPDTEYRYRVIASTSEGPTFGKPETFHTFPIQGSALPDGRAYELVSPAQKHGGQVFPLNPPVSSCESECKPAIFARARFPRESSPNGGALVYEGFPFSPTEGAPLIDEYLSKRTPAGWQTTNPTPSLYQASDSKGGYRAFNTDLSVALFSQKYPLALVPQAPAGYGDLYLQPMAEPLALSPIFLSPPPNRSAETGPPEGFEADYAGSTADLSRIFFSANDALTGATPFAPAALDGGGKKANLYESSAGELSLVNVLPGNAKTEPGAVFGSGTLLSVETGETFEIAEDFSHAISNDGSRAFWSSGSGQVYVRENGEVTQELPDHTAKFLTASADGSKVLLSDGEIYDVSNLAAAPTDLTQGNGGFKGIAGQSDDLSSIYFVDTAALVTGAKAGANNLYSWHEGTVHFIATLATQDKEDWATAPIVRTAEASGSGRWLSFQSQEQLTGFHNNGPSCLRNSDEEFVPGPCSEIFLYDSASGELLCPSCNPTNATPLGWSHLAKAFNALGSIPQPRFLNDQGRLYFDTRDSLSPLDSNAGVEDVYQYEPAGEGDCVREGGCVSLISAGSGSIDSNFLAVDGAGENVFFTTRDRRHSADRDELTDVYDARVDGGFPAENAPAECQGESCQPPSPAAPNLASPASQGFEGSGNVREKARKRHHKNKKHHKKRSRRHPRGIHRGGAR